MLAFFQILVSDFNPRSPHGERLRTMPLSFFPTRPFQPTLPARGATSVVTASFGASSISTHAPRTGSDTKRLEALEGRKKFQPTLPARGATLLRQWRFRWRRISTHAPRTGSDKPSATIPDDVDNFNPRSPHGERRALAQPTGRHADFNPRSPHGERQILAEMENAKEDISTHAPRTGSDGIERRFFGRVGKFQPTLPARGATAQQ